MSKQFASPRCRFTISAMILVAIAACALTWFIWTVRSKTALVSGQVAFNGQPVSNGQIVFLPQSPAGQKAMSQIIGGKYSLTSFVPADGAMPGSYNVVIVSPSVPRKFGSQSTSGLTASVQTGANFIDLDLR